LAVVASILIIVFKASVNALIPLYAIGVFLSFSLSQAGMAHRWWKIGHLPPGVEVKERGSVLRYDPRWRVKMMINGFGAVLTTIVVLVFARTKFTDGAYVILIVIPLIVITLSAIQRHYTRLAANLSLEHYGAAPPVVRHRVILLISGVHRGSLAGLNYARTLSDDITAVHVSVDPDETLRVLNKWETWGDNVRLVVLDSPYRLMIEPVLLYIEELAKLRQPNELITVVVPYFVPRHTIGNLLHMRTAGTLRKVLSHTKNIVITEVPYHIE